MPLTKQLFPTALDLKLVPQPFVKVVALLMTRPTNISLYCVTQSTAFSSLSRSTGATAMTANPVLYDGTACCCC